MFEIQSGVELPTEDPNKGLTKQLKNLQIKQSFVAPLNAQKAVYTLARQINIEVVTRKEKGDVAEKVWNEELQHHVKVFPYIGIRIFRIK